MGAGVPSNVMVTPEKVVGYAEPLGGVRTPVTPGRIPTPRMVAIPPGEMPVLGLKLAPLTMVMLPGPARCAVRVNVTLNVDMLAVTVIAPAVAPAVTLMEACPFEPVTADEELRVAVPAVT